MRIAQVAPLFESVPPKLYGGTERVVSYLTEELVDQGHEVTLFAAGDSVTRAHLVPTCAQALRLDKGCRDRSVHHMLMLEKVAQMATHFDVIHFHVDYLHFPLSRAMQLPQLTTMHGRLDLHDINPMFREFDDMPLVSISKSQRRPLPNANWAGNVYHGLPLDLLNFSPEAGDYLAFLGKISPEKRVDRAIRIAIDAGMRLRIAAKIELADREYFDSVIKPMMKHPLIEYIGEIDDREKAEFLGSARALVFPIDWPEPFGLVMIEAMACGTPVVAYRCGSVPEVIDQGVTGYVVDDHAGAVRAVYNAGQIDRQTCRLAFEKRFSVSRMAKEYVEIYESIAMRRSPSLVRVLLRSRG